MVGKNYFVAPLVVIVILLFSLVFVLASINVLPTTKSVNVSTSVILNITINNTNGAGVVANITQINITIPGSFLFSPETNGSGAIGLFKTNTPLVATWENTTDYLINGTGSGADIAGKYKSFWVNITANNIGNYNITVTVLNGTALVTRNISVTVSDLISPVVGYGTGTENNGANVSRNNIVVNVSATDNYALNTILINLYNSTGVLVNSTGSSSSPLYYSFGGLNDGLYWFNSTINDTSNNLNYTALRNITIDTTNPLITLASGNSGDGAYVSSTSFIVNVSATEIHEAGITFNLYNTSAVGNIAHNSTSFTNGARTMNWTALPDQTYTYNVSIVDYAGNTNYTTTRTIIIDATNPLIAVGSGSDTNNSVVNRSWIYLNENIIEANPYNITFYLYNSSNAAAPVLINTTSYYLSSTSSNNTINWTGLYNGNYSYNISIYDKAGNVNRTSLKIINVRDNVAPTISLTSPDDNTNATTTDYNFTFSVDDISDLVSCTLYFDGGSYQTISSLSKSNTNGMYNSSLSTGTHTWSVNCTDLGGNAGNSSTRTLIVRAASSSTDNSGSSGGGSGGYPTYAASSTDLAKGYTKSLYNNWGINFKLGTSSHSLTVKSITATTATVTISSTPQTATLAIGQTKKFDLDNNGYYDLSVSLDKITPSSYNKADITLKSISEKVTQVAVEQPQNNQTPETPEQPAAPNTQTGMALWQKIIIGIIIILIIVAIIAYMAYRSQNQKKKSFR